MIKSLRFLVSKTQLTKSFSTAKTLSLYTWGTQAAGLGFSQEELPTSDRVFYYPKKINLFDGKIKKVSMGLQHTAVITSFLKKFK